MAAETYSPHLCGPRRGVRSKYVSSSSRKSQVNGGLNRAAVVLAGPQLKRVLLSSLLDVTVVFWMKVRVVQRVGGNLVPRPNSPQADPRAVESEQTHAMDIPSGRSRTAQDVALGADWTREVIMPRFQRVHLARTRHPPCCTHGVQ